MSVPESSKSPDTPDDDGFSPEDVMAAEPSLEDALRQKYAEDCTRFRSDVFTKLRQHGALLGGRGWGIFHLIEDTGESSVMSDGEATTICVFVNPPIGPIPSQGKKPSVIRIMTNEYFTHSETTTSVLTTDFTLQYDNCARFFVDACLVDQENPSTLMATEAPVIVHDPTTNTIGLPVNAAQATPERVCAEGVAPFGKRDCLEDRIHALAEGAAILDRVLEREPVYIPTFS